MRADQHLVAVLGIGVLLAAWGGCGGSISSSSDGRGDGGAGGLGSGSGASGGSGASSGSGGSSGTGSSGGGSTSGPGTSSGSGCVPRTCQSLGYTCGANSDGCGGIIQCGTCTRTEDCGGGGFSRCGSIAPAPDGGSCSSGCCLGCCPKTCADYPVGTCGVQGDGCGGLTADCGTCVAPEFCGGGGPALCGWTGGGGECAYSQCVPRTCQTAAVECGSAADGCGGLLDCGACPPSETCSSDGKCLWPADAGPCVPATCGSLGYRCGSSTDGCGGWLDCGTCPVDQFCGGGGLRLCGGSCSIPDGGCYVECSSPGGGNCIGTSTGPFCADQTCGTAPNGCGGLVDCGACGGDAGAPDATAE